MPSCVFRKCTNHYSKANKIQGITYHMFPSDQVRLQDWIAIVRAQRSEPDWQPSKSSKICIKHFKPNDIYISKLGRTQIRKDAVPFIEEQRVHYVQNSPSSLDDVALPELEEILETPKESALRERVRELLFKNNQLKRINKTLTQRNKRLKKRIDSVAVVLKKLKAKDYISKEQYLLLNSNIFKKKNTKVLPSKVSPHS